MQKSNYLGREAWVAASARSAHVSGAHGDCGELTQLSEPCELGDGRTDEEIEIVVAQIKRLARTASLEFALRVGGVIIHHFYDGDASAWRSRGAKTSSFRRLARHPDLPLSAGALYRCVALFELCDRLNAPSRWEHLGASHLRLVLGLPPSTQERLLALANANRWTVKEFHREISAGRVSRITHGGRRAKAPILKSLKAARNCVANHGGLLENMRALSPEDLEASMSLLDEIKSFLEPLSSSVRQALIAIDQGHAPSDGAAKGTTRRR